MTATEFRYKMARIAEHYNEIENLLNAMPEGLQETIRDFHHSESTLQYCTRWGQQASEEILKDYRKVHSKAKENYEI